MSGAPDPVALSTWSCQSTPVRASMGLGAGFFSSGAPAAKSADAKSTQLVTKSSPEDESRRMRFERVGECQGTPEGGDWYGQECRRRRRKRALSVLRDPGRS